MKIIKDKIIEIEVVDEKSEFQDIETETHNYITENIIVHNCRPSRHTQACGYYMPSLKREEVEVVVAVDTSGSIGQTELTEFLTEMVGIAKSFNNVKMTCLVCDAEIHDVLEFTNGSINEILNTKIKGGGGTAHEPIYEWLDENKPTARLIVNFTDGYTSVPKDINYQTLWVISTGGSDEVVKNTGDVIKL
jgi:predicted metal-dependent peptidase